MSSGHLTGRISEAYSPKIRGIIRMPRRLQSAPLTSLTTAVVLLLWTAAAIAVEPSRAGVGGRVLGETTPLAAVGVYAVQLADSALHKVSTDAQGNFHFQDLPAGLYQIIALKSGFSPVVILLTRTTAQAYQYLDLQLARRRAGKEASDDDFWAIRSRVSTDVLHQIEAEELAGVAVAPMGNGATLSQAALASASGGFQAEMQALTGVDDRASTGPSQLAGGGVGIRGQLGDVEVGLKGQYLRLNGGSAAGSGNGSSPFAGIASGTSGRASSLSLNLQRGPGSRVSLTSFSNSMGPRPESGDLPIDFEHYQVNWAQDVGQNGHSEFTAHYTAENNFHSQGPLLEPLDIPDFSRSWRLEGAYTADFSERNHLQAGLRYREREFGLNRSGRLGKAYESQALSSIDLFSRGGIGVGQAVLVEYGMFSTLSDGSLSLLPQAGLVLQLGQDWQLHGSAAHRVYADAPARPDFLPSLFDQADLCEQGSASCYELKLAHKKADDDAFSVAAVRRVVGDTLRLYFSDDFFDQLQSLYLVRGDRLPELRVGYEHKLSPKIVTKLDSSVAAGGGGTFLAPDGRQYENQVRYLVASLDTKLLASSTGIFLSFRRLEQQLDPLAQQKRLVTTSGANASDSERLQLVVSQSLNALVALASDWVVQLNMELTRSSTDPVKGPDDDRFQRRILGGIAVKF